VYALRSSAHQLGSEFRINFRVPICTRKVTTALGGTSYSSSAYVHSARHTCTRRGICARGKRMRRGVGNSPTNSALQMIGFGEGRCASVALHHGIVSHDLVNRNRCSIHFNIDVLIDDSIRLCEVICWRNLRVSLGGRSGPVTGGTESTTGLGCTDVSATHKFLPGSKSRAPPCGPHSRVQQISDSKPTSREYRATKWGAASGL
jgi:hypothetical protein